MHPLLRPDRLRAPVSLAEVGRFDRMEAHIVVGRLEAQGIPAVAFDSNASVGDGSWLLIPARVMVDDEDLPAALAVL